MAISKKFEILGLLVTLGVVFGAGAWLTYEFEEGRYSGLVTKLEQCNKDFQNCLLTPIDKDSAKYIAVGFLKYGNHKYQSQSYNISIEGQPELKSDNNTDYYDVIMNINVEYSDYYGKHYLKKKFHVWINKKTGVVSNSFDEP